MVIDSHSDFIALYSSIFNDADCHIVTYFTKNIQKNTYNFNHFALYFCSLSNVTTTFNNLYMDEFFFKFFLSNSEKISR